MALQNIVHILFFVTLSISSQNFIDFRYSTILQHATKQNNNINQISISPSFKKYQQFSFPSVCDIRNLLNQDTDNSTQVDNLFSRDDQLQQLRNNILELLKLAQQIRVSQNYLKQLERHIYLQKKQMNSSSFQQDLNKLALKQKQLIDQKKQIQEMSAKLNSLITEYNNNPKSDQFNIVNYRYKIQDLQSRITYLNDLKLKHIQKNNSFQRTNYDQLFDSLTASMSKQNEQILNLNQFLQNRSKLYYLKGLAESLISRIEVDRLSIKQKQSCQKQKQKIIQSGSSSPQIKKTIQQLRQKKKEFGNRTTRYCEGIANKLKDQILRRTKAINWTYYCADGIIPIRQRLARQQKQLKDVQDKIKQFTDSNFDIHHDKYSKIKKTINEDYQKLKNFKINEYVHDAATLQKLIKQAQQQKYEIQLKLNSIPVHKPNQNAYEQVKSLAEKIKKAKANFCQDYQNYEYEKRNIWMRVYQYQNDKQFASKMRQQYIIQGRKLLEYQEEYKKISFIVLQNYIN